MHPPACLQSCFCRTFVSSCEIIPSVRPRRREKEKGCLVRLSGLICDRIGLSLVVLGIVQVCAAGDVSTISIARLPAEVVIDGRLDEACYRGRPLVDRFVVAGSPTAATSATRTWLFWNEDRLVFAFDCEDAGIVARPRTANERDTESQDRVELFLWSGRIGDGYYCFEHAPEGALHDSFTRFYRKVDRDWTAKGYRAAFQRTPRGYTAEGELPRALLESMGFRLRQGEQWRLGLFRADVAGDGTVRWLTWIDRNAPPDFHVAESFGYAVLK